MKSIKPIKNKKTDRHQLRRNWGCKAFSVNNYTSITMCSTVRGLIEKESKLYHLNPTTFAWCIIKGYLNIYDKNEQPPVIIEEHRQMLTGLLQQKGMHGKIATNSEEQAKLKVCAQANQIISSKLAVLIIGLYAFKTDHASVPTKDQVDIIATELSLEYNKTQMSLCLDEDYRDLMFGLTYERKITCYAQFIRDQITQFVKTKPNILAEPSNIPVTGPIVRRQPFPMAKHIADEFRGMCQSYGVFYSQAQRAIILDWLTTNFSKEQIEYLKGIGKNHYAENRGRLRNIPYIPTKEDI